MSVKKEKWYLFQEYIAGILREIDPHARSTSGSGNKNEKGDIFNKYIHVECKDTDKKSVIFKKDVWNKLKAEIPLHSPKILLYALQDNEYNKWGVVDLDQYLRDYIELTKYREGKL